MLKRPKKGLIRYTKDIIIQSKTFSLSDARQFVKRRYTKYQNPFGENKDNLSTEVKRFSSKEEKQDEESPSAKESQPMGEKKAEIKKEIPQKPIPESAPIEKKVRIL